MWFKYKSYYINYHHYSILFFIVIRILPTNDPIIIPFIDVHSYLHNLTKSRVFSLECERFLSY